MKTDELVLLVGKEGPVAVCFVVSLQISYILVIAWKKLAPAGLCE